MAASLEASIHTQVLTLKQSEGCGDLQHGATDGTRGIAPHILESYLAEFVWRKMIAAFPRITLIFADCAVSLSCNVARLCRQLETNQALHE
ncbi:hypothetical protein KIN20_011489 [Parelaphostrongylus tenuis]|uniref:Uncharacterized protein n=1 Tax=Parelaphostrongylus tenuis TaxID=148309 RepID=A0AAD5MAY9_PARTN|nr:hypothetical protein KIN20_011489 [Parelaphostrongylus tenuis]